MTNLNVKQTEGMKLSYDWLGTGFTIVCSTGYKINSKRIEIAVGKYVWYRINFEISMWQKLIIGKMITFL